MLMANAVARRVVSVTSQVMLLMHGFFLDIIVIGFLPFLSTGGATASRKALFPWCLGGYSGFGSGEGQYRDDEVTPAHTHYSPAPPTPLCPPPPILNPSLLPPLLTVEKRASLL